jgi:hypothetical protein
MTTALDALIDDAPAEPRGTLADISRESRRRYNALVASLANNEPLPSYDTLIAVTNPVRKSIDDLRRDAAKVRQRLEWHRELAAAQSKKEEAKKLREEYHQLVAEIESVRREFDDRLSPMMKRRDDLDQQSRSMNLAAMTSEAAAKRKLEKSASPEIVAELSEIGRKIFVAEQQAEQAKLLTAQANQKRAQAAEYGSVLPGVRIGAVANPVGENVADLERAIVRFNSEADQAEALAEIAKAQSERVESLRKRFMEVSADKWNP